MTLPRSVAIICFCFSLLTLVTGQHRDPLTGSVQLSDVQLHLLDSLASDSLSGELAVPNVFTPNNDDINDYIEVKTDGTTVYEFSVFTRTGTRVFHSLSPRIFWDGTNNVGGELKEGVYYYVIEEEGGSEPFEKAGFIHLFK